MGARLESRRRSRGVAALLGALALVAVPVQASARTVSFAGQEWVVKTSSGTVGPGPNVFSDAATNVWVDTQGRLHLRITRTRGLWVCAEVAGTRSLGHGTYTWTLDSRVDALDPNVVLGLFTWSDDPAFANREIDIEFSRWGNPLAASNAQFVVQPYDVPGHVQWLAQPPVASSRHGFTWTPGSVAFASSSAQPAAWTYAGLDVPPEGDERPRMNLWLRGGAAPKNGKAVEVVIRGLSFTPVPEGG